jgi:hypothetical protein
MFNECRIKFNNLQRLKPHPPFKTFKNKLFLKTTLMTEQPPRPKQKPIHYAVYLVIGLIMATLSKIILIQGKTDHVPAMQLFFYIGLGFTAIGLIKFLIQYYKKGGFKKAEEKIAENLAGKDAQVLGQDARTRERYEQQLQQRRINTQGRQQPQIIRCPVCGAKNYSTSNYCHMCGAKLK